MEKSLIKHGNSLAIVIDKSICELLDLELGSKLDMSISGKDLILSPEQPAPERSEERKTQIEEIGRRIAKRHSKAFKKLAE